jgi:chromate transporter
LVGGWPHREGWPALAAATAGAALTVAVTFLPSFAFVFAGAPYIERLNRVVALRHALTAISAAVIGVVAHLALWLGAATLWHDGRVQWATLAIAVALFAWIVKRAAPVPLVVLAGVTLGLLVSVAGSTLS